LADVQAAQLEQRRVEQSLLPEQRYEIAAGGEQLRA
jgi:hypothetical protein